MKTLNLLLIACLLLACNKESADSPAEALSVDLVPEEKPIEAATDTFVPVPVPVSVPDRPPEDYLSFPEFRDQYEVASLAGLRFINCRGMEKYSSVAIKRPAFNGVYATGTENSLSMKGRPLFCREVFPGRYLIGRAYEEMLLYTDLVLVDSSLQILYEDEIGCGDPGAEILETIFRSDSVYDKTTEEYLEDVNDSTKLYRRFTERITLRADGKFKRQLLTQHYRTRRPVDGPGEPGPDFSPEMMEHSGEDFALPAEAIIASNAVGVVTLEETTATGYRLNVRFPGKKTELSEQLLTAHFATEGAEVNQYTEDMRLTITPLNLTFFDTLGQTLTIDTVSRVTLRFYCENDGPLITEPTVELFVRKTAYPGKLSPFNEGKLGNIVAVVVANFQPDAFQSVDKRKRWWRNKERIVTIRSTPGGPELVSLYTVSDEEEELPLCHIFSAANQEFDLDISCCGP